MRRFLIVTLLALVFLPSTGKAPPTPGAPTWQPRDTDLTQIAALADPNADRILFWDDSASAWKHLTLGTGLTITGTTIDSAGGGVASVLTGKTLWVDSVNGDDGTGVAGRLDKPFLTLAAAKAAAASGDTIYLGPGTYNEVNVGKNGVNLYFMSGAIIAYTGSSNLGVIDDSASGANGPLVIKIGGRAIIRHNGSASGSNASALHITNSGSLIQIDGEEISIGGTNSGSPGPAAIVQTTGKIFCTVKKLTVTTSGGNKAALWWNGGECHINAQEMSGEFSGQFAVYSAAAAQADSRDALWIDVNHIMGTIYLDGDATAQAWIKAEEIETSVNASAIRVDTMKAYVEAQKIFSAVNASAGPPPDGVVTVESGLLWLKAMKITSTGGAAGLSPILALYGGTNYIDVQQLENTGSVVKAIRSTGGTHHVQGNTADTKVEVTGGTLTLKGFTVDTSASATSNPILKSGGTLTLQDVRLIAEATRDSISAASAQTVVSYSSVANTAVDSDVTIAGNLSLSGAMPTQWLGVSGGAQAYDADLDSWAAASHTLASGTLTDTAPITFTQTWNDAADTFDAHITDITDTASAADSTIQNLKVGGVPKWRVRKDGMLTLGKVSALYELTDGNLALAADANHIAVMTPNTFSIGGASAASTPNLRLSGGWFTGGSGTTTFPHFLIQDTGTTAVSTWSTAGTAIGVNAVSGFAGNFLDFHTNGGASLFSVSSAGNLVAAGTITAGGNILGPSTGSRIGGSNFLMMNTFILGWSATSAYSGTTDTGLSRISAGLIGVGTGAAGSFAGRAKLTTTIYGGVTVANLPASPTAGEVAYVTDGSATPAWGDTVTGGGSTKILVWYNGTAWTAIGK